MTISEGRRYSSPGENGAVLFLIGMRVNQWWRVTAWLPVLLSMGPMINELVQNREIGLRGRPRTFVSGRTVCVWQVWESFDHLERYAHSPDAHHLPAWRRFNRRSRRSAAVGIFHETILLRDDTVEAIYVNMPPFGLGSARGTQLIQRGHETARDRLAGDDAHS